MGSGFGTFAGKVTFSSTARGAVYYLTEWAVKGSTKPVAAMRATSVTDQEQCNLYAQGDGSWRLQLGSLLWVSYDDNLGWLTLTEDFGQAAPLTLQGDPLGQTLQVLTSSGPEKVVYTLGLSPILTTINVPGITIDTFAPNFITPSLAQIVQAKSCHGGNFDNVDLEGQNLNGIDFTGSTFVAANLSGAHLAGSTLTRAVFRSATLSGIVCDGATLDRADFTQATLDEVKWGAPASAQQVVLTGCSARRAVLGGQAKPLDCTGANLATGDFTCADLSGLLLNNASAGGAILVGCKLDGAVLDGAVLQNVVALGASLRGASLQNVNAQGASFIKADLSAANLGQAKMGAKAYLFSLPGSFIPELNQDPYPQPNLVAAFAAQGVTIAAEHRVEVVAAGQRWEIQEAQVTYKLLLNSAGGVDVFMSGVLPAVLQGATCQGTKASGASLSGADLRGVRWHASGATLDHADLEAAALSGSLLLGTNFTQAYLSGADLSNCVLVQAQLRGCTVGPGESGQQFSLEGSLLQGADFSGSTLLGAQLVDAAVALTNGVPLFNLPASAAAQLSAGDLAPLAPLFSAAGYPLGSSPTVTQAKIWSLDNRNSGDSTAPKLYRVQQSAGQLNVYDGTTETFLFELPVSYASFLSSSTASPTLVSAFNQQGYTLAAAAPITAQSYWEVGSSSDAPAVRAASYPTMRVYHGQQQQLTVYGSVLLSLSGWTRYYSAPVAFAATQALDAALNADSIGPAGYPRAWVDKKLLSLETFMTILDDPDDVCATQAVAPQGGDT